jgi:hypothetical protein
LEISWTLFENKRKIAIVHEDVYQNVELDFWKFDSMVNEV